MPNANQIKSEQQLITEQYEEYSREYQRTVVNLEKFNSKTKDLIIDTYRNNYDCGTLHKLRKYIQIMQKINQEIAAADQLPQGSTVTSNTFESPEINYIEVKSVEHDSMTIIKSVPIQISAKMKQDSLVEQEHPSKHFNYPQPEVHLYTKDHKGVCVISYVRKLLDRKCFFILDNSMVKSTTYNKALSKLANLSFELQAQPNWIPDVNDVFGVFMDNCLFRAVKQTKAEANDRNFKIFLIDIGDILDIDISKNDLYDLPKDVRIMPAQGLYCILDKNSKITMDDIKEGLYKERTFRITKIKKSTFHMDDIKPITNPFYSQLVIEQINSSKIFETTINEASIYNFPAEYTSSSDEFTLNGSDTTTNNDVSKSEQVVPQPLFIENKSTSSAIEAVMTFRPTDDMRVCHFYNPRTRSCFKGPNCKLQHLPQVEGGWSRDKVETKTAIAAEIDYPDINVFITIIPTSIEMDGSFWGQIEFGSEIGTFTKLKQLNLKLNSAEFVMNYKELDYFPVCSELVIAQYRDHLWYRAKIIGDYDQRFKVFFVDYGNADFIHLNKIRKWDNRCDYLPFQAIRCRIANISITQDNHKRKLEVIKKLILNKRMTGIVVNNLSDLDVILLDSNNMDIGNQLVKEKLATHRKTITPQLRANCNPIPQ